jgi:hypothetical protein
MKAMQVLREVIIPFVLEKSTHEDMLIFLNDIVLEMFEKVRDIYCVFDSLTIINEQLLGEGLKLEFLTNNFFT